MTASKPTALRFSAVSKSYGSVRALNRMSFRVEEGRLFVLFGPSSVGKTTALRTIAGLVQPDEGGVEIFGKDVTRAPITGRGVSMVFQSFALYPHLTVYNNFAYPLREENVPREEIDKRVKETAAMLKLTHRLERKPNTLSGGEQQRVALGRSLIRRPKILLLDEPLTNLDAKLRHEMRAEIKRLHRQFGMTIVYATPDELEALSIGEEIAILRDGAIVQTGTPDEIFEKPVNTYVAGKIGSPHMNFIAGRAFDDQSGYSTSFGVIKHPSITPKISAGAPITIGIRPNDIRLSSSNEAAIMSKIHLIEPLGDITVISVEAGSETLRLVLTESAATGMKTGDMIPITFDLSKIHVFQADTGHTIT